MEGKKTNNNRPLPDTNTRYFTLYLPPFFLPLLDFSPFLSLRLSHCRSPFSRVDTAQPHSPTQQQPTTIPTPALAPPNTSNSPTAPLPQARSCYQLVKRPRLLFNPPSLFPSPPLLSFQLGGLKELKTENFLNIPITF